VRFDLEKTNLWPKSSGCVQTRIEKDPNMLEIFSSARNIGHDPKVLKKCTNKWYYL